MSKKLTDDKMGFWMESPGPHDEIVISSRVRLARNYVSHPFPHWADPELREEVLVKVRDFFKKNKKHKNFTFLDYKDTEEIDRKFFVEQHIVSAEHSQGADQQGLVFNKDRTISIMVNEEDHLRIQGILPGFQLDKVWEMVDKTDDIFAEIGEYGFSERWGYLTACPTNTGTGLRASTMLHLPALGYIKKIDHVLKAISQLGLTSRGMYGEGTSVIGDFYQISNQITLGRSEKDLIGNIEGVTKQIIGHETEAREHLLEDYKIEIENQVCRAYGVLKNSRVIQTMESINLLSKLRLGVYLGIMDDIPLSTINQLIIRIQPAHLQKSEKRSLDPKERDIYRAKLIRETLP